MATNNRKPISALIPIEAILSLTALFYKNIKIAFS